MDVSSTKSSTTGALSPPAWNLSWLTVRRCRIILLLILGFGFLSHVRYLKYNCPIDLSGDEAQYWDWSRQLDLSYYSKGPLVAYIIRASCSIFGDTMQAVRYPALVFGVGTSLLTYLLVRKLFDSERLALGTVLLFHIVPMFIAGSTLMTIDPPMFFCWALATYLAAHAIFDGRRWAWVFVGIVLGVGFLAKYAELLWYVGAIGFLVTRREFRRTCLPWCLLALVVSLLFATPVLVWNSRNDWVSFRHVAHQTGASGGKLSLMNVVEMLAGQWGAVGPTIGVLMVWAVVATISRVRRREDRDAAKLSLLVWLGLSFFAINLAASIRTKVQLNWPAPSYFTLLIVTAHFLGQRLGAYSAWKPLRGWFLASVAIGIIFIPIAHDTGVIYPLLSRIAATRKDLVAGDLDPLARLRGWKQLGRHVASEQAELGGDPFIMCDDYQQTAEMAFYVPGHPRTYCAGSYFGKRLSQYDVWSDRRLDASSPLIGSDCVYVGKGGKLPPEIVAAFERIDKRVTLDIDLAGGRVRTFKTWRCYGFKGLQRGSSEAGQTEY